MKRQTLLPLVLLAVGAGTVYGQDAVPTTQPGLLTIYMEEVKLGMDAAHAMNRGRLARGLREGWRARDLSRPGFHYRNQPGLVHRSLRIVREGR